MAVFQTEDVTVQITTYIGVAGVLSTCLLVYLIHSTRQSRKIEGFGFAVVQNLILDMLFVLSNIFVKYDIQIVEGFWVFGIYRFDRGVDDVLVIGLTLGLIFLLCLMSFAMWIPFFMRYSVICRKRPVHSGGVVLLYLATVGAALIVVAFHTQDVVSHPPELEALRMRPYLMPNSTGRYWNVVAYKMNSVPFLLAFAVTGVFTTASFGAAIHLNMQVRRFLRTETMLPALKKQYRSLQLTMVIQFAIQSLMLELPLLGFVVAAFTEFKQVRVFSGLIRVGPTLTSIATILSVPEFRQKLKFWVNSVADLIWYT